MHDSDYDAAYRHTSHHRAELEASDRCGCFYCLAEFPAEEIERWLNEGDGTAVCPRCGVDSVIGSASGFPINRDFLSGMHHRWFEVS